MASGSLSAETILIVDDEEPVRRTFHEWLESAQLGCTLLSAADAESALVQANQHTIDLAILDWNLGAGNDGLQLLEDLAVFNADVVAIMITGFAHQATPLAAMRMGVRDYLDKNQDLDRETFLKAVRRQLERIRPARRERQLHERLVAFRATLEKVLPLVQASAALYDPVPLPEAIGHLFRFLLRTTGAREGVLLVHSYDASREPAEVCRAYDSTGQRLEVPLVPFARSLAGGIISRQEACALDRLALANHAGTIELQPFERDRQSLLAAPLIVGPGLQVVLELFDKQSAEGNAPGFTEADRRLALAAAVFGVEMLRQALAERTTHRVLFDAIEAALGASDSVQESLHGRAASPPDEPPPVAVLDRLREGLRDTTVSAASAEETLRLAEAVRELAVRHGPAVLRHCTRMVESLRGLLDEAAGVGEARP